MSPHHRQQPFEMLCKTAKVGMHTDDEGDFTCAPNKRCYRFGMPTKTKPLKTGRPPLDEPREALTSLHFKADAATLSALAVVERTIDAKPATRRSAAIRKSIAMAAEQLKAKRS
jgi:hypothetical protein